MLEESVYQKMTYVHGYGIRYLDYDSNPGPSSEKDVLVLLHGIGASAERWLRVFPALSKYYHVIAPDIVGFGYSDKPTIEYNMDFFIDFLQGFFDNLKIHRPSIIASSFGGHVATEYAIRFSRNVNKLVLTNPAGIMRTSTPVLDRYIMSALYPTFDNALRAFRDMAFDPTIVNDDTVRDFVNRMRLPNAKYAFMSTLLAMKDSEKLVGRLSKILCPTLIIWGDKDRVIPVQYAKEYSEIPNRQLVVIKDCGHTPFVEKPSTFNKIALNFLVQNEKFQ